MEDQKLIDTIHEFTYEKLDGNITNCLTAIIEKLKNGQMSAMIGAGFSKNANSAYPDWSQLMVDAYKELYPEKYESHEAKIREEIIKKDFLRLNRHNLVVHASALPKGKGWSPLTWQILEGKSCIPITLFEATEHVDAGCIYLQEEMHFDGTELIDDLRDVVGAATCSLCLAFVREYPSILQKAREQSGEESFYMRRKPEDSRLDLDRSLRDQINLLRVVDNERYPAFFEWKGKRYYIAICHDIVWNQGQLTRLLGKDGSCT